MEDAAGPGAGDVRSERAAGGHSSTVGPAKAGEGRFMWGDSRERRVSVCCMAMARQNFDS